MPRDRHDATATAHRAVAVVVLVASLAAGALAGCAEPEARAGRPGPDAGIGVVERIVDGDTIDVVLEGRAERVRLIGVDTPETVDPDRPAQCFGAEATARVEELVPPGTEVRVERDVVARDRYGRLLVYLWRAEDELLVNLVLVEEGLADAVTYGDNEALYPRLVAAEAAARDADLGLWGACGGPDVPLDADGP